MTSFSVAKEVKLSMTQQQHGFIENVRYYEVWNTMETADSSYYFRKSLQPSVWIVSIPNLELQQNPELASCYHWSLWRTWKSRWSCWEVPPLQSPSQVAVAGRRPVDPPALESFQLNPQEAPCLPQHPEHLEQADKVVSNGAEAAGQRLTCRARCLAVSWLQSSSLILTAVTKMQSKTLTHAEVAKAVSFSEDKTLLSGI